LGAGEKSTVGIGLAARRNRVLLPTVACLIDFPLTGRTVAHLGFDRLVLRGNERREPVFVGEAEPPARALIGQRLLFDVGIAVLVGSEPPAAIVQLAV